MDLGILYSNLGGIGYVIHKLRQSLGVVGLLHRSVCTLYTQASLDARPRQTVTYSVKLGGIAKHTINIIYCDACRPPSLSKTVTCTHVTSISGKGEWGCTPERCDTCLFLIGPDFLYDAHMTRVKHVCKTLLSFITFKASKSWEP